MSTDVNKAIQELLYEQATVIVPGLGGFISTPSAATIDYVQDVITPAASKLEFNPNLVLNDGLLVQYLQKHNLSTYQEAGELVEQFVASVRAILEKREIYEIPKVGRLYQDYEQKIRFMPDGTNFNAESFGLPLVEFQPLAKEKTKAAVLPPKPPIEVATVSAAAANNNGEAIAATGDVDEVSMLTKVLPWMVLLAAILIALALYKLFGGQQDKPIAEVPDAIERVNVKPMLPSSSEPSTTNQQQNGQGTTDLGTSQAHVQVKPSNTVTTPVNPNQSNNSSATANSVPEDADTEQDDFEPSKKKLYLVVHSFGKKSNATNFARTLTEDGYSTETKKTGNLYRVGVNFAYKTKSDIDKMRSELAAKYKAGPKTEKELEEMGQ